MGHDRQKKIAGAEQTAIQPLLVVVGPTAVGKTVISLELGAKFDGEIVSADSRLFYRGMDIGTAKPTAQERELVAHHLIDICWPDETLTLGEYHRLASRAINDVLRCGRLPILVGGTGQYIRAIVEGWSIPEVSPQQALRDALFQLGRGELNRWLHCLDPESAERIDPRNTRRVIRALEVTLVTGRPFSHFRRKDPPDYALMVIGLTCQREELYKRIDERVDRMMKAGFLDEVIRLRNSGYGRHQPSMSGLGYSQLHAYLDDELGYDEAIERIKFETHRFARQQYSWFRSEKLAARWFDVLDQGWQGSVFQLVADWLEEIRDLG